jgi:hypothetical protein
MFLQLLEALFTFTFFGGFAAGFELISIETCDYD